MNFDTALGKAIEKHICMRCELFDTCSKTGFPKILQCNSYIIDNYVYDRGRFEFDGGLMNQPIWFRELYKLCESEYAKNSEEIARSKNVRKRN